MRGFLEHLQHKVAHNESRDDDSHDGNTNSIIESTQFIGEIKDNLLKWIEENQATK